MPAPRFSVVMPTYNRADTLQRAIDSVIAQRFTDWELIVVDDGSTDATPELLARVVDPRVRKIRQQNRGVAGARNAALRATRGELISFLDSDDEWLPHHLALMAAFFEAFPSESLATSEWWEIFAPGKIAKHFYLELGEWYPATAARIGSKRFAVGPPRGDPLLWYYDTREPIGDWARPALATTGFTSVQHWRGNLFEHWRWGWLTALQPTVLRRSLLERLGEFDESYTVASDFPWLAKLSGLAPMNLFGAPSCYKHERTNGGALPKEGHLVTGKTAATFHEDVLRGLEELYLAREPNDPDLLALRGFRSYLAGHWALQLGQRRRALSHLERAAKTYDGPDVEAALWLARALPRDAVAGRVYRASLAAVRFPGRVRSVLNRLTHPAV